MLSAATWPQFSDEIARIAEAAGQSVIALQGDRAHTASGVLWQQGVVITANHAARHDELTALLPGGAFAVARVKGRDPSTDLAIFTIEAKDAPLAPPGDAEQLRVGNFVLALGRTRRGNLTASSGIISGLMGAWETWGGGRIDRFIRPDITLYRGYSGGALVNARGEIVGINTSGLRRGTPIAIPTSTVTRVVDELLAKGHITRPYLGVVLQPLPLPESLLSKLNTESRYGLLIVHLDDNGPAANGGLMLGDIIIEVGGKPVAQLPRLHNLLANQKVGDCKELSVVRSNERKNITVTLGERADK